MSQAGRSRRRSNWNEADRLPWEHQPSDYWKGCPAEEKLPDEVFTLVGRLHGARLEEVETKELLEPGPGVLITRPVKLERGVRVENFRHGFFIQFGYGGYSCQPARSEEV